MCARVVVVEPVKSRDAQKSKTKSHLCALVSQPSKSIHDSTAASLSRVRRKKGQVKKTVRRRSTTTTYAQKVCSPCLPLHPRGAPPGRSRHELGSCRRAGSPTAACCALAQGQRAAGAAAVHAPAQHAARSSLDDQLAAVVATRSLVALPCTAALGRAGSGSRGGQQLTQLSFV